IGPSQLTLTGGTGDVIYVGAGAAVAGAFYTSAFPTTSASNASITVASGVGTSAAPAQIVGNNDAVNEGGNAWVSVTGTNDTVNITGAGTAFVHGSVVGGVVTNGGVLQVLSGSTASNVTVSSGGTLELFGGGTATGTTFGNGGILEIGSG